MYTVIRDENDNYCVINLQTGVKLSPLFSTEGQAWHWLDKQENM